eukprot:scaffold38353_cov31-Tisochrysis_lutea.AAC.3
MAARRDQKRPHGGWEWAAGRDRARKCTRSSSGSRSRVDAKRFSATARVSTNAIVRIPCLMRAVRIRDASANEETRRFAAPGAIPGPPSSTTQAIDSAGIPVSVEACSRGLAMVAEHRTKRGDAPYRAQMRRSRRRTSATCEPKMPWYECASSTTTSRRLRNTVDHSLCCGRMLECSISGFVAKTCARARSCGRSIAAVSPSKVVPCKPQEEERMR